MKQHFLYPSTLLVANEPYQIDTVLGSCVAVVLYDPKLKIGGMNHYMLPFWNGQGLASPKYGNIAIEKLIEGMLQKGSNIHLLQAKVFGGAEVLRNQTNIFNIGSNNIMIAKKILEDKGIKIIASHTGGTNGRKIRFFTETGQVGLKNIPHNNYEDMEKNKNKLH